MKSAAEPIVAICVATYKRTKLLDDCIRAILRLEKPDKHNIIVIIVDNDSDGSARTVIEDIKDLNEKEFVYIVEKTRGLASVRNRLLNEAIKHNAKFICFIDDDEFPHPKWLINHLTTMQQYNIDIVAGPVISTYETRPQENIKIKYPTGHTPRNIATGNVIFKKDLVTKGKLYFNTDYNFIGGEDFDFFDRASQKGFFKTWCANAIIYETVSEKRKTKKYLFYRHFTGAITNVVYYKSKKHRFLVWAHFLIKALGKFSGAILDFVLFLFTFNNKKLTKGIIKLASATGYISGLLNIIVERYRY